MVTIKLPVSSLLFLLPHPEAKMTLSIIIKATTSECFKALSFLYDLYRMPFLLIFSLI